MNDPTRFDFDDGDTSAQRLADRLEQTGKTVVLVESCTSGLAAAMLGGVPGISRFFAGSFVVYQDESKKAWLGVDEEVLLSHTSVSREVTATIVRNAIKSTPHADFAVAITGHLGPDAPAKLDGIVFVAIVERANGALFEVEHQLSQRTRQKRQFEAAEFMLDSLVERIT